MRYSLNIGPIPDKDRATRTQATDALLNDKSEELDTGPVKTLR